MHSPINSVKYYKHHDIWSVAALALAIEFSTFVSLAVTYLSFGLASGNQSYIIYAVTQLIALWVLVRLTIQYFGSKKVADRFEKNLEKELAPIRDKYIGKWEKPVRNEEVSKWFRKEFWIIMMVAVTVIILALEVLGFGVVESFSKTMRVLENMFPEAFKGVVTIFGGIFAFIVSNYLYDKIRKPKLEIVRIDDLSPTPNEKYCRDNRQKIRKYSHSRNFWNIFGRFQSENSR